MDVDPSHLTPTKFNSPPSSSIGESLATGNQKSKGIGRGRVKRRSDQTLLVMLEI
jgi:hypothetical protein